MKKVLLLSLSLALGFGAFAQQRVAKDELRSATAKVQKELAGKEISTPSATQFAPQTQQSVVVNRYDDMAWDYTIHTTYDLQSNHYVANRMVQFPDGSIATTATMSHEYNQTASDRGTGYNFYNGEEWQVGYDDLPDMVRVEPWKTGWPSIAQWKDNGEILLAHGNGHMQVFTRDIAGQGEWQHRGNLPDFPEGYPYSEYPTWPRVVTCGENHDVIIAVAALQHSISSDETDIRTCLFRSEDAENWTASYGPLEEYGYHIGTFSADDYALAANGHTVALLYSGCLTNSTWMFKSTDDGLTWNATRVWENPYEGREFDEEPAWGMEDTLFMPMNGAIVIDNNDVVHVALNTFEMAHTLENEPGYYTYWSGRAVDGILYWNDTQEAPIQDTYHPEYTDPTLAGPNPHNAARLWWPIPDEPGYVHMVPDSTKWIGYIPMYEGYEWSNDSYYMSGTEYVSKFHGASGHPALSCDPQGNLACAFSSPNCTRYNENKPGYYRSIYVSYRNVDEGYWHQVVDDITEDFMFSVSECLYTFSATNTVNSGEFWFGFQADDQIGFYWGSNASQTEASDNDIIAVKVIADPEYVSVPENHEAVNPMTAVRVYPNPATDVLNIEVNASQSSDMSINVFNIMGQKVQEQNVNINAGINTNSINTAELASGIYFVTVKANGFENTMKFIVK